MKHGKLEIGELKAAIKDGKLDQVVTANQDELEELEAARAARRAKRRAAQASGADGAAADDGATDGTTETLETDGASPPSGTEPAPREETAPVATAAGPAERRES